MTVKICNRTLVASTLLHLTVLCHHAMLLWGFAGVDLDKYEHPVVVTIKPFKFFTISGWCFQLQIHHAVLSLAAEWQHWRGRCHHHHSQRTIHKYERYKDTLFRGLVLPCTLLVSSLFWALYYTNRELIYPVVWDSVVPTWLNHGVHTSTALFTVLELMIKRSGVGDPRMEANIYWSLSLGYAVLLNSVYLVYGTWFYPFLGVLSWYELMLFQLLFSAAGRLLLDICWRIDGIASKNLKVL